jgi:transitional endoplasmic reticulum ATPase
MDLGDEFPIAYEDIGGLGREIASIREQIEYPLKFPGIFDRLGIMLPKGVILYGPEGWT